MSTSRKTILVADDDRLLLRMVSDVLAVHFDVKTATHGEEALRTIERESLDGVVCDHQMPHATGLDVLRECRRLQPGAARILVTATDKVDDLRDAVNLARVHRFVEKPLRPLELLGIVQETLREIEIEQENQRLVAELQRLLAQVRARELELERALELRTRELEEVTDRSMPNELALPELQAPRQRNGASSAGHAVAQLGCDTVPPK